MSSCWALKLSVFFSNLIVPSLTLECSCENVSGKSSFTDNKTIVSLTFIMIHYYEKIDIELDLGYCMVYIRASERN